MPNPDPSWDCPCGVRNAGTFFHCRRCSAPRPRWGTDRDPDEWLKIRTNTPLSQDILQFLGVALLFILAGIIAFAAFASAAR